MKLEDNAKKLLKTIADMDETPQGAYNIRVNGKGVERQSTDNVDIVSKADVDGIDIIVKPNVKEFVHIPVVITTEGVQDKVYNDFYIGENSDVVIVAGCGIHNDGDHLSQHDGIHTFHLGKNSKVKYTEKHYGSGSEKNKKVLNPVTVVNLGENSVLEMETVQIEGVDETLRVTKGVIGDGAALTIKEVIMTSGVQTAYTEFEVDLAGENSRVTLSSRSVAKGNSKQEFKSQIVGNNACTGHSECDAIIMDNASVSAIPLITANHVDASLIHEAAIGKIAGEQIIKLMSLGLDEKQAEEEIIKGFLK